MTSMSSLMRELPIGAHEEPLIVELVGTVTVKDLVKSLKEAYKEAGPRCGANIIPAWKVRDAKKKAKAQKGGKEEEEGGNDDPNSTAGNPLRIVLRRPIHLKSASATSSCRIMLQSTSIVVSSHSVTLENCDLSGWGRSGVSWDETIGLLEVSEGGDCELKSCNFAMDKPPSPVVLSPDKGPKKKRSETTSPTKAPQVRNCSIMLVQDGGRVTADSCSFTGSPNGYGVVARGQRTRLLMEGCQATENFFSNVLVSHGANTSLINCSLSNSKEGYGLSASDSFTQVYCKETTFDSNSRDNCYSVNKAKVILEDCKLQGSQTRSGLRVEGDGSVAVARVSAFESNSEHAIRVSWGGWASAKGCEYVGYDGRGTMTLSEAITGRRTNGTTRGSSSRRGGSSYLSAGLDEGEEEDEEIRTAVEEMEDIVAQREAEKDIALIEGPSSTLLQDLSLGRPSWKYISTLERPWTKPESTTVTLRS